MALSPPIHLLLALLALPPSSLPSSLANPNIHASISALLASLSAPHVPAPEPHLRPLLHALVARLAQLPKSPLASSLLALYLRAFLPLNAQLARSVVADALASNVRLAGEIRGAGVGALKEALAKQGDDEAARTLLALVRGAVEVFVPPSAAGTSGQEAAKELVSSLVGAYERVALSSAVEQDHLRLDLLETAHALFSALSAARSTPSTSPAALDSLHALLPLLLPPKSNPPSALAADLQTHFSLSATLVSAVQGSVGPTSRSVKDQLGALRRAGEGEGVGEAEWLERLKRAEMIGGAAEQGLGVDKGEEASLAGAVDGASASPEKEAEIASAISQLLDLFPSSPTPFLRACLLHRAFAASSTAETTERVVAALLEDDLPADLKALRDGEPAPAPAPAPAPPPAQPAAQAQQPTPRPAATPAPSRQNIYDDDALFTRGKLLVGGKERKLAPSASASSPAGFNPKLQLSDSLKASIIALAERPSSDEEDSDNEGEGGGAFLEEEEGAGERAVKVGDGEGRESGDEDEREQGDGPQGGGTTAASSAPRPAPSGAYHPSVTLALESAYLAAPALFARDAATRRSKARKELRERTGLGDEQVEGWKVMLERDAKKMQKLRDKHQDLAATGNHPRASAAAPHQQGGGSSSGGAKGPPPHQQQQPQQQQSSQGGGRGGRGGGQGRGGRGGGRGGQSGRKESDRAVRGRDKKMQRMGAGPPT
ncbi:hypothetical protein JCM6882_009288 [Rhodosporidiobolus microsporus]